jgi:hypothetical protein
MVKRLKIYGQSAGKIIDYQLSPSTTIPVKGVDSKANVESK